MGQEDIFLPNDFLGKVSHHGYRWQERAEIVEQAHVHVYTYVHRQPDIQTIAHRLARSWTEQNATYACRVRTRIASKRVKKLGENRKQEN